MSRPVFIVGMQRNGTTFCARTVRLSPEVDGRWFAPYDRWDIPAAAEIGGDAVRLPHVAAIREWVDEGRLPWRAVKFALPFAIVSFGWARLAELFPAAKFVLIVRGMKDARASWFKMPHVVKLGIGPGPRSWIEAAYVAWHHELAGRLLRFVDENPGRAVLLRYEELVLDADVAAAPVWKLLDVTAPVGLQATVRKPAHWSLEWSG